MSIGSRAADSLADVLRLLDAWTGSRAEVKLAQPGVLRICAHVRGADVGSGLTALRVLLAADLLARVAELGGLQVLTALAIDDPAAAPAALERDAGALGIHPPTVRTTSRRSLTPSSCAATITLRTYGDRGDQCSFIMPCPPSPYCGIRAGKEEAAQSDTADRGNSQIAHALRRAYRAIRNSTVNAAVW